MNVNFIFIIGPLISNEQIFDIYETKTVEMLQKLEISSNMAAFVLTEKEQDHPNRVQN